MKIKFSKFVFISFVLFLFLISAGICAADLVITHIDDKRISENERLTFNVTARDTANINATIRIEALNLPAGATFRPNTQNPNIYAFDWTPRNDTLGTYHVTFRATVSGGNDSSSTIVPITVIGVDKTTLLDAIAAANGKLASVVPGNEVNQYPQSAIDAFRTAISTAKGVADNTRATQTGVNNARSALATAEAAFDAARITSIDKSTLTTAIAEANAKVTTATPGTGIGQYSQASIDTFRTAIAAAQTVANNGYATNAQVSQAVTTLKAAEAVFDAAEITTTSVAPPAFVTNLEESAVGSNWIKWTWTNPSDSAFSHVKIYIDGKLISETNGKNYNYYVASGFTEGTSHIISIQTIDVYGNINPTFVNDTATTSTVNENINVELVNRFGGSVEDVAVAGNYAYLRQGCDFVVVDITDVSNPAEVGRLISKSLVSSISISGNYAYLVDSNSNLRIVDIADPTTPTLIGSYNTGGKLENVDVLGNYVYLIDSINGLLIMDISNPSAPTSTAIYDTAGSAYDIALSGNYAYIASDSGLEIVDLTTPSNPKLVGNYNHDDVLTLDVEGNYAYIRTRVALEIVDISNPYAPNLVGVYGYYSDNDFLDDDVTVSGNYAFLFTNVYSADEWYTSLLVLDITNPSSPQEIGTYETVGYWRDVAVSGNYVYVAGGGSGLLTFDVTDPSEPKLYGSHFIASDAYDIDISGNYAYLSDGINGLEIFSINDPSSIEFVGGYHDLGHVHSAIISGNNAYVTISADSYGTAHYVMIVDISNPTLPTLASQYESVDYVDNFLIDISGNYAYIGNNVGFEIEDISNPSVPTLVGSYNYSSYIWGVAVEGNYAYIASDGGLEIVDITIPSNPKHVGNYNPGYVLNVVVEGNYAYISSETGLKIVDISIPSAPTPVGTYITGGNVVAVSGNYAYIYNFGNDQNYLEIVDLSNPSTPHLVGVYTNICGYVRDVAVSGNYIYVVDNGLSILRMDTISDSVDYPPIANAGSDTTVTIGSPVTFDGSGSTDDNGIVSYSWDFDASNGITSESTSVTPTKTYATIGTYTVTLTVTDTRGQKSSDKMRVTVSSPTTTVSYAPLYDNRLRESSPTSVFSTINYLDIGKLGTTSYRDVMLFDLSSYKTTDTISKATLSLYWYYPAGATRTSDTIVEIYRPLDWDPQYVTWNSRLSGTLWSTAGGSWFDKNGASQGATPYASLTFPAGKVPDNKYYDFDVTQLVQEYVSGKYKNTGFFLKAKTESGNYIAFYSSEWTNAAQRPKLTVTATSGPTPTDTRPVAKAGADKTTTVGTAVTFDGSASTDDKPIPSYAWNFGDGTTATGVSATHKYTTAATYTVTLTVTDTAGQKSSDTLQVVVSAVPPPASTVSYTPIYDNRLKESSATTVLSTTSYIDVGRTTANFRDVMLFDLSSYKTTDTISKATLSLYWYYPAGKTRTFDTIVEVYRPVEWDPKYVTWNSRNSGTYWATAGGNWFDKNNVAQGTTPYASLTFAGSTFPDNKYYDFDVTQLVQEYVSGKYKNTGFFLKARTESGNYIAFYGSEWTNAAQRPKLTVTAGASAVDNPPVANAGADKTGTVGSPISFDGSASTDDIGIVSYSWDFNIADGITTQSTSLNPTYTYNTAGTRTVILTVTDAAGQKSTDTLQVIVSAATTPASTVSYAPLYDNRLRDASTTTVLSTSTYIDIGRSTSTYRDVMLFDLSSYKTTDAISKATLSLYWYFPAGATRTSDTIVEIYRPLDWDPQYVTWNSRLSGTLWSTAGGNWFDKNGVSQGATPYASLTFAGSKVPDNKYYEFDVTQLVQEYVSGKYKNTGFFLKAKTESGNYIAFYSSEWSNAAQRPKLSITSTTGSTTTDSAPVANAGADKTATTNSAVTFDGSASTDDKGITSYSWDFDASNGITSEATGVMTAKAYTTAGTYTVTLTVTDTAGQKSTDTLQVTVSNLVSSVSYAPLYDNRLRSETPTSVLSTTNYLDIGRGSASARDVMIFDLSSYKTTDAISKATLSLYWYFPAGKTRTSDTVVEVYRPVEWDPKYVTWNSRISGTSWSNAGGSWYDKNAVAQGTTPYASLTFAGSKVPDNKYYEFDVTQLVQDYISGKYKNTGFFLKAKTESGNYIAFYSSEYSNAAMRPKLTITR